MGRPKVKLSLRKNGDSYQGFEDGEYIGSASVRELIEAIKEKRRIHTEPQKHRGFYVVNDRQKHRFPYLLSKGRGTRQKCYTSAKV